MDTYATSHRICHGTDQWATSATGTAAGFDIERNARALLEGKGWRGTWTRLLITDEQSSELSSEMVVDVDGRDGQAGQSIETAAVPVGDARDVIHRWLDGLAPVVPDADESERGAVVAALEALGA